MLSQVLSQDLGRTCCVWVTSPEPLSLLLPAPDWVESALGMGLSVWAEHGRVLAPLVLRASGLQVASGYALFILLGL